VVPSFLYLPDGRVVPTCVVLASQYAAEKTPIETLRYTSHLIGGGYPLISTAQGALREGSVGCVVTDAVRYYALTNQHVTGKPGTEMSSLIMGEQHEIGVSAAKSIRHRPFAEVYNGFPGTNTMANLDVGLVEITDAAQWTGQIYGLGKLGPM